MNETGFSCWTIIKPPLIMENLFPSKSAVLFPTITDGKLLSAFHPEIMLDWISPQDIGRFSAKAFTQPEKCNRKEFVIVGDKLTLPEYTSEEYYIKDRDAAVRIIKGFLEERKYDQIKHFQLFTYFKLSSRFLM